jgi:hypothetical protein
MQMLVERLHLIYRQLWYGVPQLCLDCMCRCMAKVGVQYRACCVNDTSMMTCMTSSVEQLWLSVLYEHG